MLEEYNDILSVKDVKQILGYKSDATIYKMLRNNKLKYKRLKGGKYLIIKSSLVDYLQASCYNEIPFELPKTQKEE